MYKNKYVNVDNIITHLEIEALKKAKELIGFLYPDFYLSKAKILNPEKHLHVLKNKISKTFDDRKKRLFN